MLPKLTYLALDAFTLLGPLALSFDRRVAFYRWWRAMLWGLIPTGIFFLFWDALFTYWGIWWFNYDYLLGPELFALPLEEWLFFLVVPYACIFIYACVSAYGKWSGPDRGVRFTAVLGVLLLITGLLFFRRAYTLYAFAASGIGCLLAVWLRHRLGRFRFDTFLLSYAIILIPFLLVNGVLTALPVVIYNNNENLGIRMYTIPFEDTFYGLLLVLGNIAGTEWARGRRNSLS